jgi:hypothetical protein
LTPPIRACSQGWSISPRGSELDVPIAGLFRLDEVQEAYRALEQPHTTGKIVLRP